MIATVEMKCPKCSEVFCFGVLDAELLMEVKTDAFAQTLDIAIKSHETTCVEVRDVNRVLTIGDRCYLCSEGTAPGAEQCVYCAGTRFILWLPGAANQ